jgi:hypothetical protein
VLASIRVKLIVPLVGGLVAIAVAIAVLMRFVYDRGVSQGALLELQQSAQALAQIEDQEESWLGGLAEVITENETLAEALRRQDRSALLAEAGPIFERLKRQRGVTHWYFHPPDPAAGVLLRVHQPELRGDVVERPSFLRAVASGRPASGVELGRTAYAVRVVRPWYLEGRLIGYLELGTDIHAFLDRLKRMTGNDFAMLLDKRPLERAGWERVLRAPERWDQRPELVEVENTSGDEALAAGLARVADLPAQPAVMERMVRGGKVFIRGLFPLRGHDGRQVGAVAELHEITPLLAGMDELRVQVVVLVLLLASALAALLVFLLDVLVLDPIARMSRTLEELPQRMARGEWSELEGLDGHPRSDDEIGRFEVFLDRAIAGIGSFVTDARRGPSGPEDADRGDTLERPFNSRDL